MTHYRWYEELHFVKAMGHRNNLLGREDASSTDGLDFLLGDTGEEAGLDNHWLLGENTLAQNLVITGSGAVDDGSLGCLSGVLGSGLFRHEGPQLVQVNSVMVLTTSVSATSGVLPVLSDPSMTVGHVSSQLPGLLLGCGHSYFSCRSPM